MSGFVGGAVGILRALDRLSQVEKANAELAKESRAELKALRQEMTTLREAQIRLEGRLDQVMVNAGAAAQSAAALAVAGEIGAVRERLALLEARPPKGRASGRALPPA